MRHAGTGAAAVLGSPLGRPGSRLRRGFDRRCEHSICVARRAARRALPGLAVRPSRGRGAARRAARQRSPPATRRTRGGGDVPDRRGLLLHARLPAGHRVPGRRAAQPAGDDHPGAAHPVRRPAGLPPGRRREPARAGLDRHAGAAAAVLARQALRARACSASPSPTSSSPSRFGRRRQRPRGGEPARPGVPARPGAVDHPRPGRAARRGLPQGLHRGDRRRRRPGRRPTWRSTPSSSRSPPPTSSRTRTSSPTGPPPSPPSTATSR